MASKQSASVTTKGVRKLKPKDAKKNETPHVVKEDVFDDGEHLEFSQWVAANEQILDAVETEEMIVYLRKKNMHCE